MDRPILTIAVPTYNGARTIRDMLDIMLPQVDERVEVLVSDNCSNDETPQIIAEYCEKYPFIKTIRNEKNIGADGNFLQCMRLATGRYILLLSDDDILTENSLGVIMSFLEESPEMGLVYLGTANFYAHYLGKENCTCPIIPPQKCLYTQNKKEFMEFARHYWGFVSSFIISNERFEKIKNAENYFGTYWLQSYIQIMCASGRDTYLGIVEGIRIAAGVYITQSNFDTSFVDGVSYRKMLDFAVENGFDKKQLDDLYIKRLCLLASHGIIKEKATGNKKIDKRQLFDCTKHYLRAWIKIYPMLFVPSWVCRTYMKYYRKKKGVDYESNLNRAGDVATQTV